MRSNDAGKEMTDSRPMVNSGVAISKPFKRRPTRRLSNLDELFASFHGSRRRNLRSPQTINERHQPHDLLLQVRGHATPSVR